MCKDTPTILAETLAKLELQVKDAERLAKLNELKGIPANGVPEKLLQKRDYYRDLVKNTYNK